jgi:FkbM family methyltransferase
VIGFEPLADRAAARRAEESGHSCEIIEAFIGDGGERVFHENNSNTTSSLLPLDREMCGGFVSLAGLRTVATSRVRTTTLDALFAADAAVDFLKLDIQGFELAALRGAVAMLPRVAMIQSEVEFTPIYSGQPLFSELELFLRGNGFDFLDFHAPARRAPVVPSGSVRNEQLLCAGPGVAGAGHPGDRAVRPPVGRRARARRLRPAPRHRDGGHRRRARCRRTRPGSGPRTSIGPP